MSATVRALALIGAGGLGRETAELVRSINADRPTWHLVGFYDDDPALQGTSIAGLPVIGPVAEAAGAGSAIAICTARPAVGCSRARLSAQLALGPDRLPALVHPSAALAPSTVIGSGSIVLAGVVVTADVTVGAHVVVMPQTVLTHDDRVDDFVTIASGVRLGGGVHVEREAYLGAGAMVREGLRIGEAALVGMGSVVLDDVPGRQTWVGVPARPLAAGRSATAPADALDALQIGSVTA
jgi:sugar O-acyltransferase (sialic acid O-acetyltransferase NeuD family)